MSDLTDAQIAFIKEAAQTLENPNFMIKVVNYLGQPIEKGIERLPEKAQTAISKATKLSLEKAFQGAVKTLRAPASQRSFPDMLHTTKNSKLMHTLGTALTGAAGGAFGYAGLAIELPITTGIMLRSIADIAQECGFDPLRPDIQLECLSVFSMGSPSKSDDASETGYYAARAAMTKLIQDAVAFVAEKTAAEIAEALAKQSAPVLVRLLTGIAGRFEVVVTEKLVLEALPVIGALTGAGVNVIFTSHFCNVARYHFGLKRLEQLVGAQAVQKIYFSVTP